MLTLGFICLTFVVYILDESDASKRFVNPCQKLLNCLTPTLKFTQDHNMSDTFDLLNDSLMAMFCPVVQAQALCVMREKGTCNLWDSYHSVTLLSSYYCSDIGRTELRKTGISPCVANKQLRAELYSASAVCSNIYAMESTSPPDTDYYKNARAVWRTCTINGATKFCGPEYGQFVRSVVNRDEFRAELFLG